MSPPRRAILLPLTLALSLACDSGMTPSPPSRVFVLTSVNDQPLPAILTAQDRDTTTVLWGTLHLGPDARAILTSAVHHTAVGTFPADLIEVQSGRYRLQGDSLSIGYAAPCPAACPARARSIGHVTDSTVTLTLDVLPRTGPVFRYRFAGQY